MKFQIFTNDNYKEKIVLEANELSAYRFLLAYEQDQRSQDGLERVIPAAGQMKICILHRSREPHHFAFTVEKKVPIRPCIKMRRVWS